MAKRRPAGCQRSWPAVRLGGILASQTGPIRLRPVLRTARSWLGSVSPVESVDDAADCFGVGRGFDEIVLFEGHSGVGFGDLVDPTLDGVGVACVDDALASVDLGMQQ